MSPTRVDSTERRFLQHSGAGLMAVATAPALASWASPGTNEATLRVGALFPVSGTNALWVKNPGTECRSPLTCANAASGVAGKQIELVFADVNTVTSEARS